MLYSRFTFHCIFPLIFVSNGYLAAHTSCILKLCDFNTFCYKCFQANYLKQRQQSVLQASSLGCSSLKLVFPFSYMRCLNQRFSFFSLTNIKHIHCTCRRHDFGSQQPHWAACDSSARGQVMMSLSFFGHGSQMPMYVYTHTPCLKEIRLERCNGVPLALPEDLNLMPSNPVAPPHNCLQLHSRVIPFSVLFGHQALQMHTDMQNTHMCIVKIKFKMYSYHVKLCKTQIEMP